MPEGTKRLFVFLLFAGLSAGCFSDPSDDGTGNGDTNNSANTNNATTNNGETTNNTDANANANANANNNECVPATTCEAGQCGMVDDGCGGTIECDVACNCVDGVPVEERCGGCGLGVWTCEAGATSTGTCEAPPAPFDIDPYEGDCEADLIYVDTTVDTSGDGTIDSPFATIADALAEEPEAGQSILVHAPEGDPDPGFSLDRSVNIIGGFDSDFRFSRGARSFVRSAAPQTGNAISIEVSDVDEDTVLYGLDVESPDAPASSDNGYSSIGMLVARAENIRLENLNVAAGNGSAGATGAAGANGADGGPGEDGTGIYGMSGGTNPDCPVANGGDGGDGGTETVDPDPGENAAAGTLGGIAGQNGSRAGKMGETGVAPTTVGSNGVGGVFSGRVVDGEWTGEEGVGSAGEDGLHGPGGGGGGGAFYTDLANPDYIIGPGGAGGGAGGCAGKGGEGGGAGGASFAILLADSMAVTIADSTFTSGDGGDGGDGGAGGAGGLGGDDGEGTSKAIEMPANTPTNSPVLSGDGGFGADGTAGGEGGGGAGGPTHAVYCANSDVEFLTDIEAASTSGEGGAGGGTAAQQKGEDGPNEAVTGCNS